MYSVDSSAYGSRSPHANRDSGEYGFFDDAPQPARQLSLLSMRWISSGGPTTREIQIAPQQTLTVVPFANWQ